MGHRYTAKLLLLLCPPPQDLITLSCVIYDHFLCSTCPYLLFFLNHKNTAFSMTYNGMPVRPYERYSKATTELCKGLWPCSAPGVATLTWHNDYSKW